MLKKRIIPIQLLLKGRLVKTKKFRDPRDVGNPVMSSKVYSSQDADELILLNVDRAADSVDVLVSTVKDIARECFVPFSVGGGINSLNDAKKLFAAGADKIIINSVTFSNPAAVTEIAEFAGSQAVVVGIDVKFIDNLYVVFSNNSKIAESVSLSEHIRTMIRLGAGEIFIQSIDRDGEMQGYDINLLKTVLSESSVPVIAAGGAGNFGHLDQALKAGVNAVACGSLFNFGDNNPLRAKAFLKNLGNPLKRIR